ncbi:MAG: hypothetical protein JSW34_14090, partial [Candidatus Zixiibacteriota bacterium]
LDGDSDHDLAVANNYSHDVSILFNLTGECPEPEPCLQGDVNDDGQVDVLDILYMVDYMWLGGPPPVPCP